MTLFEFRAFSLVFFAVSIAGILAVGYTRRERSPCRRALF